MLSVIYASGSVITFLFFITILHDRSLPFLGKLVMFSIAILPLGKLIYFPIPGFYGLKITFIVAIFTGLLWTALNGLSKHAAILFISAGVAVLSLICLEDPSQIFFYEYQEKSGFAAGEITGTTESVLLRIVAYTLILLYCATIYSALRFRPAYITKAARYFIYGTLAACLVGTVIFAGVWDGSISAEDLAPISVDSHLTGDEGRFYRFNPGANVNEFSMIVVFAIFLLSFSKFPKILNIAFGIIFVLCEFAGLTRSSWLALLLGLILGVFFSGKKTSVFKMVLPIGVVFVAIFVAMYIFIPDIQTLIDTRTALDIGVSGDERLIKFNYVFDKVSESPFRLFFGYGWSTNLYVHNVYLQLLYEIGLIGLISFLISIMVFLRYLFRMEASPQKASLVGICVFIFVSAGMQHTLYHTQTWLMLGFVAAASVVKNQYSSEKPV